MAEVSEGDTTGDTDAVDQLISLIRACEVGNRNKSRVA